MKKGYLSTTPPCDPDWIKINAALYSIATDIQNPLPTVPSPHNDRQTTEQPPIITATRDGTVPISQSPTLQSVSFLPVSRQPQSVPVRADPTPSPPKVARSSTPSDDGRNLLPLYMLISDLEAEDDFDSILRTGLISLPGYHIVRPCHPCSQPGTVEGDMTVILSSPLDINRPLTYTNCTTFPKGTAVTVSTTEGPASTDADLSIMLKRSLFTVFPELIPRPVNDPVLTALLEHAPTISVSIAFPRVLS